MQRNKKRRQVKATMPCKAWPSCVLPRGSVKTFFRYVHMQTYSTAPAHTHTVCRSNVTDMQPVSYTTSRARNITPMQLSAHATDFALSGLHT